MMFLIIVKSKGILSTKTWLKFKIVNLAKFCWFHDISLSFKSYFQIGTNEFHKTRPKVVSHDIFDNCQVWRHSVDRKMAKMARNMVKIANLAKISLISRYFLVFQVIFSDWHVEISQNSPECSALWCFWKLPSLKKFYRQKLG